MTTQAVSRPATPARIKAILVELDKVAAEYTDARTEFETAKVHFETARERFAVVKRIASELLGWNDWYQWQTEHQGVKFAGAGIGEAIIEALHHAAVLSAIDVSNESGRKFVPDMTIDGIVEALESGGFEFRTATPKREVNAALMKLEGVRKLGDSGKYEADDAYEVLEFIAGKEAVEAAKAKDDDDDVPF